jgi:hypothetical protein
MDSIFIVLAVFWKVVKKTKMPSLAEMDLLSGKAEIDAMESTWVIPQPRNFLERVSQPTLSCLVKTANPGNKVWLVIV